MILRALAILLASAVPAIAAGDPPAEVPLDCAHLAAIDASRESANDGFERIYAAVSTMTTAGFCGDVDLEERVDQRIRDALRRYDDRSAALSPEETLKLRQLKASYVLGRQMIDRSK